MLDINSVFLLLWNAMISAVTAIIPVAKLQTVNA